jgi:hypothetical protein
LQCQFNSDPEHNDSDEYYEHEVTAAAEAKESFAGNVAKENFGALRVPPQENFELFVSAERTGQLASPESCAYTEFVAVLNAPSESIGAIRLGLTRRRGHVFDDNPA